MVLPSVDSEPAVKPKGKIDPKKGGITDYSINNVLDETDRNKVQLNYEIGGTPIGLEVVIVFPFSIF
jgi:hypothetical protein